MKLAVLYHSPLAKRIALRVLQFAALVAMLITLLEVGFFYQSARVKLEHEIINLGESRVVSLAAGCWNVDYEQIDIILKEMAQNNSVSYITLITDNGKVFTKGQPVKPGLSVFTYKKPLRFAINGQSHDVGELQIGANWLAEFNTRNFAVLAISEVVKILLIAVIVTLIVYRGAVRHLLVISEYLRQVRLDREFIPLSLDKQVTGKTGDELDLIAGNLNQLLTTLQSTLADLNRHRAELEMLVDERTAEYLAAKNQAQLASLAKTTFLAHIAHELRNPLTAITGYAELLQKQLGVSTLAQYAGMIIKAGDHQLALINESLDIAKIESGVIELNPQKFGLNDLIAECILLNQPQATERDVSIASQLSRDYLLFSDRFKLKQVLLNLISNAIKYNRDQGRVEIETQEAGNFLKISIRDTGKGMDSEQQKLLFQPFERVGAEKTGVSGTGIGLVICRQLIEKMGGELGFQSIAGKGSCFWLTLPVQ